MQVRRALLLANEHARQVQDQVATAAKILSDSGVSLIQESVDHSDIAQTILRHKNEIDVVIVAGGDGTMNSVVDAVVATKVKMAILPLGTANDLALTLGIPSELEAACKVITDGHFKSIDLGWVNGKHFFNVASIGLSVKLTEQLTRDVKRRLGIFAYPVATLRVLTQQRPFRATLKYGDVEIRVRTMQITVGNGHHYGGGMSVAHDAAIDDQSLDVYSIELGHWWQFFPLLTALRSGRFHNWDQVRTFRTSELKITTSKAKRINTDGEITTKTPAHFRVVPHAVEICVPASTI